MDVFLQLVLAVLPCALLMYLILYMDRNEREPMGLVIRIMAMGGIMVLPAALIESAVGGLPFMKAVGLKNAFYEAFLSAAPIEELCKLIPVLLFAWNRPEFNEENDGIVYAGASALGFALVENVFFVLGEGLGVGVLRAVSSIPLHCFAGIVMGYYIGKARFAPGNKLPLLLTGFAWAYFAHGLYDTLSLSGSYLVILLLPMIVVVFWVGFSVLKRGREVSLSRSVPGPAWESEVLTLKTALPEQYQGFPPSQTGCKPRLESRCRPVAPDRQSRIHWIGILRCWSLRTGWRNCSSPGGWDYHYLHTGDCGYSARNFLPARQA